MARSKKRLSASAAPPFLWRWSYQKRLQSFSDARSDALGPSVDARGRERRAPRDHVVSLFRRLPPREAAPRAPRGRAEAGLRERVPATDEARSAEQDLRGGRAAGDRADAGARRARAAYRRAGKGARGRSRRQEALASLGGDFVPFPTGLES